MAAIDHRGSFKRLLLQLGADVSPQARSRLKLTVWKSIEAVLARVPTAARTAILIDRGHPRVANEASEAGVGVAVALEASGQPTLRAEAAPDTLKRDLWAMRADMGKALLRWNPDDSVSRKRSQLAVLRELEAVTADAGVELLLELLISRPERAASAGTARLRGQAWLPHRQYRAVEEILDSGVIPAAWKIEGHGDSEAAAALAALVTSARPDACMLVLGGGAEISGLPKLFACAAKSQCFNGFAVGRSIWQNPLAACCRGEIAAEEARRAIGDNFISVIDAFESACSPEHQAALH